MIDQKNKKTTVDVHNRHRLKVSLSVRMFGLFLLLVLAVFGSAGQGKAETKEFVVGFDAEFPPYGYMDSDGEYIGFDLDLAQEVCNRRGWKLVKRPISWNSKDSELASGSVSCLWNGFTMNGRENQYTWSTPYVDNSQVVVVRSSSGIEKLSDLKGKILVVQSDSSALAALTGDDAEQKNKDLADSLGTLQQVEDYNTAFMNLESGSADAVGLDLGIATYQLSNKGDEFKILEEKISTEQYGIGFKKGNIELRDQVQETLAEMSRDGTFKKIAKKWGLESSVCFNPDDVPADKKAEQTQASANAVKKMSYGEIIGKLWDGMLATLGIFALTLLFSLPLGLLIMEMRISRFRILSLIARIYISIMRGTPLMLQLLVVFFAPYYLFGISTSYNYRFYAVIIGFSVNYAAYFAEIYRSGLESIPRGQTEAATVLGYSKSQIFFRIIFPQMIKRVIPTVTNEVITLVKDTSLAFAIAYTEMFTIAKQVSAAQASLIPLFIAGVFYFIFNFVVAYLMEKVEKRLSYYQ